MATRGTERVRPQPSLPAVIYAEESVRSLGGVSLFETGVIADAGERKRVLVGDEQLTRERVQNEPQAVSMDVSAVAPVQPFPNFFEDAAGKGA